MYYWIYNRLGVHIYASETELDEALDRYAARAFSDGVKAITPEVRKRIHREHTDARKLATDLRL